MRSHRVVGSGLLLVSGLLLAGCGTSSQVGGTKTVVGPAGPAGLTFKNAYDPLSSYSATDVVTYQGSSYVALAGSTNVLPVGVAGSAADWAMLAQAGATGPTGLQGAIGAQGVAGVVGATGVQGPTGPAGLHGTAGANMASFLQGKNLGVQGDSISSVLGNTWQSVVTARTGMTLALQDAAPGRTFASSLQCWGNPSVGQALGNFNGNFMLLSLGVSCSAASLGLTTGDSFAQSLASVDIEVIQLGTNDQSVTIGSLGDPTTAGTFYGNIRWVVEAYLKAKPTLRVVLVTPQYNTYATAATTQQYVNAMVSYGNSMGVPVINMYALGGVNPLTINTLTLDGVHPTQLDLSTFYGPVIAHGLQQIY